MSHLYRYIIGGYIEDVYVVYRGLSRCWVALRVVPYAFEDLTLYFMGLPWAGLVFKCSLYSFEMSFLNIIIICWFPTRDL